MRLTIDQHDLHSALSVVSRAVKGHPTFPTLSGVLMRAEGDRLHLTGTDLDLTIEAKVTARVEEAGEVILPVWGYVDGYRAALVELLTAEKDKARGESGE